VSHVGKKGSFWWKDLLKLCDIFKGIAQCSIGNGSTIKFWSEVWNGNLLEQNFPRLFLCKNKNILVASFIQNNNFEQQFHVPLSVQAFQEYQEMQDIIHQTEISSEAKDI
jgi:hypothetical protein